MIKSIDFKTKTTLMERGNETLEDNIWGIALDIGYSSVKGFSPNMVYSFPSYAKKESANRLSIGKMDESDIMYKNNITGDIWIVGESAQNMIKTDESNDSVMSLYGRNRYFNEMFEVITEVGLGLGLMNNAYGNPNEKDLLVQTGLPPAYMKSDTPLLKEVLGKEHNFSMKVGNGKWISFRFNLPQENIKVMPQPMGTLLSIATDQQGRRITEARDYLSSSMLIFDPGFGTLDIFNIQNQFVESSETFDDLGMKRVLEETANEIFETYQIEVPIPAMQKALKTGTVKSFDRKSMTTVNVPFTDILERCSRKVCLEAISKIKNIFNNLIDYDYLVITGGTGAAWSYYIKEHFAGMETLTVVNGNQNDNLPFIFSNVRGYYMYLLGTRKKYMRQ